MQAIILAAGKGSRLKDLTNNQTKSMVKVNGMSMIERLLKQLDSKGLSRIILVDGYKADVLEEYIKTLNIETEIEFITNTDFDKTNNIYSLQLTQNLWNDDTVLFESDLIFEDNIIDGIINSKDSNIAVLAKFQSWMDGTVVTLNSKGYVEEFIGNDRFDFDDVEKYYKTVNVYKMSGEFLSNKVKPFLNAQCKTLGLNSYYETTFNTLVNTIPNSLGSYLISDKKWYEIDNRQDLDIAESIFENNKLEKLKKFQKRYGGYWRYPGLVDFCYIVNPFFPSDALINEMQNSFRELVIDYPSGQNINNLLAAEYLNLNVENVLVGNGAAELIKALIKNLTGKFGIIIPTFEEYANRLDENNIVRFSPDNKDFKYNADNIIDYFSKNKIDNLVLINPDNPSGNYLGVDDLEKLFIWAETNDIKLILDESFVDFADRDKYVTALDKKFLERYSNLIVVKSISKSYGIPGLRLGVLASSDMELLDGIRSELSIWNINSFGEFFLQIIGRYKNDFDNAIDKFHVIREDLKNKLNNISYLKVIDSQANYFMCEVMQGLKATDLSANLLDDKDLFIKDLTNKQGINGEYVRIAIKRPSENERLISLLKQYEEEL